jgi:hypothetical protein
MRIQESGDQDIRIRRAGGLRENPKFEVRNAKQIHNEAGAGFLKKFAKNPKNTVGKSMSCASLL